MALKVEAGGVRWSAEADAEELRCRALGRGAAVRCVGAARRPEYGGVRQQWRASLDLQSPNNQFRTLRD